MADKPSPAEVRRYQKHLAVWLPVIGLVGCLLFALASDSTVGWVIAALAFVAVLAVTARVLIVVRATDPYRPTSPEGHR